MTLIAAIARFLICVADLDHCDRWTWTPSGLHCPVVRLGTSCPAELEQSGWHSMRGVSVCTRDCGAEGAPTR